MNYSKKKSQRASVLYIKSLADIRRDLPYRPRGHGTVIITPLIKIFIIYNESWLF